MATSTEFTEDQKFVLLECALVMNYGWKQIPKFKDEEECKICLESMKDQFVLETSCGHCFHDDCILTSVGNYKTRECVIPNCQKKFTLIS